MVFGLFKQKKKPVIVPLPPEDLPSFPSPEELELDDNELSYEEMDDDIPTPRKKPALPFDMPRPTFRTEEEPLFLKVEAYQSIIDMINYARGHLDRSGRMVARLEELHEGEKNNLNHVHDTLHEAHDKLLFIDGLLFKKG